MTTFNRPSGSRAKADVTALLAALEYFQHGAAECGFVEASHLIGCARQSIADAEAELFPDDCPEDGVESWDAMFPADGSSGSRNVVPFPRRAIQG
ncbi:MAG: hypothetical protein ABT940_08675 [Alphaproteobacteria bacterium]